MALGMILGCGTQPSASVSDFNIYTALHLRAAELADDPDKAPTLGADLHRYFATTQATYDSEHLRMDSMLDSEQRRSGFAQALQSSLATNIAITLKNLTGAATTKPSTSGTGATKATPADQTTSSGQSTQEGSTSHSAPTSQPATRPTDLAIATLSDSLHKLVEAAVDGTVTDSPFDQLDRAADFYAAYILKSLRLRGDSRVVVPDALVAFLQGYRLDPITGTATTRPVDPSYPRANSNDYLVKEVTCSPASRLILLSFQVHVNPGTRPNYMTGVRIAITDSTTNATSQPGDSWTGATKAGLVKILRLHPSRTYDVDATAYGENVRQSLAQSGSITAPLQVADISASGSHNASVEAEMRSKFLSRIGKQASFSDAATHTFGWNFFPSNLQVVRPNALESIIGWLFGTPRDFNIRSYLDGGGRDCSVILLVPRNLASFTCKVRSFSANVDPDGGGGSEEERKDSASTEFTVSLPTWSPHEVVAGSMGVFTGGVTVTPLWFPKPVDR